MAEPRTIEEVIARNFAADVAGGEGISPEDAPAVKRPLPPVGHFGYTEEDAEAVREENKRAGATLENSETIWEPNTGETQGPVEDAAANTERAEREAALSARTASDRQGPTGPASVEEGATGPTGTGDDRGPSPTGATGATGVTASGKSAGRGLEKDASGPASGNASERARERGRGAERSSGRSDNADKNKQQVPAAQSRSGAASKGDDGDNSNNPGDESDKK